MQLIYNETKDYRLNGERQNLPGFSSEYRNIVDYIAKITDTIWEERAIWLIYDTYAKNVVVHDGAETWSGVENLITGTLKTLSAFPDRKMNHEAIIWSQAGKNHFHSSHRIGSTATNSGATPYGHATHKAVQFRTIADCLITENRIIEEWLVRDNLGLLRQLGFDPVKMAKEYSKYRETSRSNPVTKAIVSQREDLDLSQPGDLIVHLFQALWNGRQLTDLAACYHPDALLHAICDEEVAGGAAIRTNLEEFLNSFPDASIELQRITCNEKPDGFEVAARWKLVATHAVDNAWGTASGVTVAVPGISHYIVRNGKISEEWMLYDGFDLLCQIHASNSPQQFTVPDLSAMQAMKNKQQVLSLIDRMNTMSAEDDLEFLLSKYCREDTMLHVSRPFDPLNGIKMAVRGFWEPFLEAFPDVENQPYIVLGGTWEGRECVVLTGNLFGTFRESWLGISPTRQPTAVRYAANFVLREGKISHTWMFLDILDVMRQAGYHFFPNRGLEWVPPGPMTGDGIVLYPTDNRESRKTFDLTFAMIDGLLEYDGKTLKSMAQERFWDVRNMMWYGPSGIGTTRGLKGFQDNHQLPFLKAFPNRGVVLDEDQIHFAQVAEGNYSAHSGFPSMYATHTGGGWLGLAPTGKSLTMRVIDFWRREGDKLKENWVMIDMIDILEQLGVDVFELLKQRISEQS